MPFSGFFEREKKTPSGGWRDCSNGALDRARTYDPQNRNLILYPTELRARLLIYYNPKFEFCQTFSSYLVFDMEKMV